MNSPVSKHSTAEFKKFKTPTTAAQTHVSDSLSKLNARVSSLFASNKSLVEGLQEESRARLALQAETHKLRADIEVLRVRLNETEDSNRHWRSEVEAERNLSSQLASEVENLKSEIFGLSRPELIKEQTTPAFDTGSNNEANEAEDIDELKTEIRDCYELIDYFQRQAAERDSGDSKAEENEVLLYALKLKDQEIEELKLALSSSLEENKKLWASSALENQ